MKSYVINTSFAGTVPKPHSRNYPQQQQQQLPVVLYKDIQAGQAQQKTILV